MLASFNGCSGWLAPALLILASLLASLLLARGVPFRYRRIPRSLRVRRYRLHVALAYTVNVALQVGRAGALGMVGAADAIGFLMRRARAMALLRTEVAHESSGCASDASDCATDESADASGDKPDAREQHVAPGARSVRQPITRRCR